MRLYSTLQRTKVELPQPPARIRMYFCGPTVYARAHIGNARPFILGMWLRRWLLGRGYDVTLVHNITDVNDKIYDAAPGASAELAKQATKWYLQDTGDLGLGRPDESPLATEYVPQIVHFIEELIAADHAYAAGGDVYFRVASYSRYGELSGRLDGEGTRNPSEETEPGELKEDPRDFALWKGHKEGEDTSWDSPWGRGRPGWHIECSAMAEELLGPMFEIHGGGLDLVFPHHENELAQSRAIGHEFAQIWTHNGMLRFTGEKMSKSLGNVVTMREAIDTWGRETVLLFFMRAHWSKPIDFSEETMGHARTQVERFRNVFVGRDFERVGILPDAFVQALDDDFNTPLALSHMHEWASAERLDLLHPCLEIFGLGSLAETVEAPAEVAELAVERDRARSRKDFAAADLLRQQIEDQGWEVRDVSGGFQLVPK